MNKDNVIAMEFLLTTKAGIKNNAMALIESTSDEIRNAIIQELQYLLNLHEEIYQLMIKKEWLFPEDIAKQIEQDTKIAQMTLNIADLKLFSNDIDKLSLEELLLGLIRQTLTHI